MDADAFKEQFFTRKILEWASTYLRKFPWRENRSIYRVYVSEIFLQRTKADQVQGVYEEFIGKFSTLDLLSSITEDELNLLFAQLGLRKRAGYFYRSIQMLADLDKQLSTLTDEEWSALPGVGQYSLNAIKCFGMKLRVPIVDSNIVRIFARFFDYKPVKLPARNDPGIWAFAEELLPIEEFVYYNYALIDFGSLSCKARDPYCADCMLQSECCFHQKSIKNC